MMVVRRGRLHIVEAPYCFGKNSIHMSTPDIPDIETRDKKAEDGADRICKMVDRMDMAHVVEQLRKLEIYGLENEKKYPWMPAAWNRNHSPLQSARRSTFRLLTTWMPRKLGIQVVSATLL